MLENMLPEEDICDLVSNENSPASPYNILFNLSKIKKSGNPVQWQNLADFLTPGLQEYTQQKFGIDKKFKIQAPFDPFMFECFDVINNKQNSISGDDESYKLKGICMNPQDWLYLYFIGGVIDARELSQKTKNFFMPNSASSSPRNKVFSHIRNLHRSGTGEFVNIRNLSSYHEFVFVAAHEAGHSVAYKMKYPCETKRSHEVFASNFSYDFMNWYSKKL